jgi:hypothetical protein
MLIGLIVVASILYLLLFSALLGLGLFFRKQDLAEGEKPLSIFVLVIRCLIFPFWYPYVLIKEWMYWNL